MAEFTPALGISFLTPLYDFAIKHLTREHIWRERLAEQIAPRAGDVIVDVGCGTGTLMLMLKRAAPEANVMGFDPDPVVLRRAVRKASSANIFVKFLNDFLPATWDGLPHPNKFVSSLVFHQVPLHEKLRLLEVMFDHLQTDGEVHIADYGEQRTQLMRSLYRMTVQLLDGVENTQTNADGLLPKIARKAGFRYAEERSFIPTPTGSISLYRFVKMGRSSVSLD